MVQSTIEPKTIQIDTIKNGVAEILVHWNVTQDEEGMWNYEECRMQWVLPDVYPGIEEVMMYLDDNEQEIVRWAKGSKVSL